MKNKNISRFHRRETTLRFDAKTTQLIHELTQESRISATQLAKKLHLSREATGIRIKKIEELGVSIPLIFLKKIGFLVIDIYFLLDESKQEKHKEFIKEIIEHPNTVSVITYNETWDLRWSLVVKDLEEYEYLSRKIRTKHKVIIGREKYAITKRYTYHMLPDSQKKQGSNYILDNKDIAILHSLSNNARKSCIDIAKETNLSIETVILRIKKMRKTGVLFTAAWNLAKLGYEWHTYALTFSSFDEKIEKKIEEFSIQHNNIISSVKCFGKWDVIIEVLVKNSQECNQVVRALKTEFAQTIQKYEAWNVYEELIFNPIPKRILENYKKQEEVLKE